MNNWVSRPDEVDKLIAQWGREYPDLLQVESKQQYCGRPVWALTLADHKSGLDGKRKALCMKPHAHEPAPIAAQMNILSQLLTGRCLDGSNSQLPRRDILDRLVLCFIPDANPGGTERAPVEAWDGSQYTNEEFWAWMRGVDPETGRMWKRVDLWDDSVERPLPLRYGIVYEQISEHEYVEPNRHKRSTLLQWVMELRARQHWDLLLDLHQTEFTGDTRNCMIILPTLYDEQPEALQQLEASVSEAIVAAWAELEGGRPIRDIAPLNYTGEQREYFVRTFGDIYADQAEITSEVQNNSLLTPPPLQQRLTEVFIETSIRSLLTMG